MNEQNTQPALVSAAMEIILHAGDARNDAKQAREAMREMNFTEAHVLIGNGEKGNCGSASGTDGNHPE